MQTSFGPHFLIDCLSIIFIDLLLAGDNALVIALVVRGLPRPERRMAVVSGALLAVILRVALTFTAAQLLKLEFVRLAGGIFVAWIAVKVLLDASSEAAAAKAPRNLLQAICWIVLADITMSVDNILAVAGASKGSFALILFGLAVANASATSAGWEKNAPKPPSPKIDRPRKRATDTRLIAATRGDCMESSFVD